MTLGDRCDEIVRLIDETLESLTTPVPARLRPLGALSRQAVAAPGASIARTEMAPHTGDAA